jgi:uncharacterized protein (TIGR02611 family)
MNGGGTLSVKPDRSDDRPGSADNEPGLLDEVAERLGFRDRLRANPALKLAYRIAVGVVGAAVVLLGLFLVPFPGPGWLVVFIGLGILATEFAWAERLLHFARSKVRAWTHWFATRSLAVRGLLGIATLIVVAGAVLGYVAWRGVPFTGD